MPKTLSSIMLAIVLFTSVVIAGVLFPLPHQSKEPPGADDTGSTEQGVMDIATANNRFAFDLYFQLDKSEHRNLFYSPYGISAALAMTYEGAKGRTADEMKSVFHFPESRILRPNFAAIHNAINKGANDYELRTGNALWVQRDFPLLEDYQSRVEKYYGGKGRKTEFFKKNEKTKKKKNKFIRKK